jgi:hypothetical protein
MAKEKAKVETRKDEVRYFTSEPKEMLNKYLVADVLQKWTEDFMDEDTQEVVSIERTQKLFEKGRLIDQDLLTQIQFHIQAGSISQVEVSNQKRLAFECQNTRLHPWQAQAEIGDKKYKFLLYASGIANVIEILNDYIELNYASGFALVMAKEMDSCIILTDNFEKQKVDLEKAYLKDEISLEEYVEANQEFSQKERNIVFCLGVGGLLFVPVFKSLTHLAPYVGILLVLGVLWTAVEVFLARKKNHHLMSTHRVTNMLQKIDMTTILFFLGILMTVATLQDTGVLTAFGEWLNEATGANHYAITGVIGAASAIVDNVPLVAGCMGMYPIEAAGALAQDGIFWQLLAYCAGVGGSMLIIGSAAGVVVMGLENISFGWYLKNISWLALAGYLAGIVVYAIQHPIFQSLGLIQ